MKCGLHVNTHIHLMFEPLAHFRQLAGGILMHFNPLTRRSYKKLNTNGNKPHRITIFFDQQHIARPGRPGNPHVRRRGFTEPQGVVRKTFRVFRPIVVVFHDVQGDTFAMALYYQFCLLVLMRTFMET